MQIPFIASQYISLLFLKRSAIDIVNPLFAERNLLSYIYGLLLLYICIRGRLGFRVNAQ